MQSLLRLLIVLAACVAGAACTSVTALRTDGSECEMAPHPQARGCGTHAVEAYADFKVAYVELTDMGLFYDRQQMLHAVELATPAPGERVNVIVYVHGWKHSAEPGDSDVEGFVRNIVPALASGPAGGAASRTVGIYVGWRGTPVHVLRTLSFYDRKGAADHIARGSVRELLSHLRAIRVQSSDRMTVTVIGHSFGGLILFNAISGSLMDSLIVDARAGAPSSTSRPAPFDLAVLLNPAFEGIRFEPLFQAAIDQYNNQAVQPASTPGRVRPLLISITSSADWATGMAFPLGRSVNSLLEHEGRTTQDADGVPRGDWVEKRGNRETVGHLERYRTHQLTRKDGRTVCTLEPNPLVPDGDRFALWNIYADGSVIQSHGDVFNAPLWAFLSDLKQRWDSGRVTCAGG